MDNDDGQMSVSVKHPLIKHFLEIKATSLITSGYTKFSDEGHTRYTSHENGMNRAYLHILLYRVHSC